MLYEGHGASAHTLNTTAGIGGATLTGAGCAWGDYDNDGHLDLILAVIGTLFMPPGYGPWPAVVFVHGAGAQPRLSTGDRARVEAYVRAGFAAMVYDKRGVGASTGDYRRAGLSELADDALAGLDLLRERSNIIDNAIGLHGRGQGSWIPEIAAARSPHVGFVVAEMGGGVPHAGFDPAPVLRSLEVPVLFALAEGDRSTPTALTLEAVQAARAGCPRARIEHIVFEGADHAMLTYPPSGIPRLPKGYPGAIVQWVRFMLPGR